MSHTVGKTGDFVCIVAGAKPGAYPLYWTGEFKSEGRPIYTYNHLEAAQFENEDVATFTAAVLGLPGIWHLEQHGWG